MRRILLLGAVVLLSLSVWVSPAAAITGGKHDNSAHPNVGVMYMENLPALVYGLCSGSLLSPTEFLVAGHCTAALSAYVAAGMLETTQVFVSFDEELDYDDATGLISTTSKVAVTGWDTHPAYGNGMGIVKNDVGVIHLAEPQQLVPIELPDVGFLDRMAASRELVGRDFVNVGYGLNSIDRSMNSPRRTVTWEHRRMVSETPVVALSSNTLHQDGGLCGGDSGGPHFWGDGDPNLVVAVTASGSANCGPDASQRIDLASVLDWLHQYD
jgi:secreted trypsin-like serine protease